MFIVLEKNANELIYCNFWQNLKSSRCHLTCKENKETRGDQQPGHLLLSQSTLLLSSREDPQGRTLGLCVRFVVVVVERDPHILKAGEMTVQDNNGKCVCACCYFNDIFVIVWVCLEPKSKALLLLKEELTRY